MRHLLIEDAHPIITDYLKDFCAFACGKLGIESCPPITFVEHTGSASFGSYSPSEGTVIVATHGRHAADILRTLAHELVHDQQISTGSQAPLEEMEFEANAVAGMLMREYNQAHPGLYGVLDAVADQQADTDEEHESFGQGVPTNPPYPTTFAEDHKVAVKELTVSGLKSYHAHCLECGWKSKGSEKEITAVLRAKEHAKHCSQLKEDAPVNAAGTGQIAGLGVGSQGEPGVHPKKKKSPILAPLFQRKTFKQLKESYLSRRGDRIVKVDDRTSPIYGYLSKTGKPSTVSPEFKWKGKVVPRRKKLSARTPTFAPTTFGMTAAEKSQHAAAEKEHQDTVNYHGITHNWKVRV